jgi:CRISPR-associated protein Csm1
MQIFLEARLLGIDECLLAPTSGDPDHVFTARSHWVSLLGEVLPRALLAELGLARALLGSSGGGRFLLLLPIEQRESAEAFLTNAAADIAQLSGDTMRLIWSHTENLGIWSDIRRRLQQGMNTRRGAPGFSTQVPTLDATAETAFVDDLGFALRDALGCAWSPEHPGRVTTGVGKHSWAFGGADDPVSLARHTAPNDEGSASASPSELAQRASGAPIWGVLRGDVDNFALRMSSSQSIEEHVQHSVMYKSFFARELDLLCSLPDYWRKVSVLYSGGDDFAVYGAWDALIALAGEIERIFHRFTEHNLKDQTGPEGKTITMAIALAPSVDASLGAVFEEAGQHLEAAKSAHKDCIWLLGRTLEWKQFAEAGALKESLGHMVTEYACGPHYLRELCGIYRETHARLPKKQVRRQGGERPWRYHRRIRRILNASRMNAAKLQDYRKARTALIADLIGRSALTLKLRPSGRVALEWARLSVSA